MAPSTMIASIAMGVSLTAMINMRNEIRLLRRRLADQQAHIRLMDEILVRYFPEWDPMSDKGFPRDRRERRRAGASAA